MPKSMTIPKAEKLPSGSWRIQLRLGGKSYSITNASKVECEKEARLKKAEYLSGKQIEESVKTNLTLRQACEKYVMERNRVLSPATVRGYNEIIRNRFQGIMDQKITDINNWQIAINEEAAKVAAKTVENAWLLVKPVLKNERIPVPEIRLPQVASNDQPWLTYEEIQLLLKEIKGKPVEIGALLALHGLRRSEIYALDKKSIDLSANAINVRGARVEAPEGGYVKKPQNKNRTSARIVPIMIPRLAEAIREMAPDQKMLPYSEKHLCDQINKRCRAAGITEVGTHGCRRSFASMCAHEGVPLDICAKLGGWADIVTMKKIYLKVCNNDLERYADVIRAKFE